MTKTYEIAALGGDGIGPDVVAEAVQLLNQLQELSDLSLSLTEYSVGAGEYLESGNALPDEAFDACRQCDAVLLGAMGLPDVRYPNGKEIAPQLDLRERLGLFGGVRPVRLFHANDTPLKDHAAGDIDFVLVRESTEGLFHGRNGVADLSADTACDTLQITRAGTERVCRLAFELARKRNRTRRVTLIDKANVLPSMVYFRHIFDQVADEFPDIETEHVYVDAAALFMVRRPADFDVLVTENMFGDILSDLAAGLVGGMGMAPSADLGESAGVFQPAHGSAPDIAGKGIANPIAMFLSAAMMLDWLGDPTCRTAATAIEVAVADVLSDPALRTPDMGGAMTTRDLTGAVSDRLPEALDRAREETTSHA